jgi:probable HAF family extracellular repeat protein
MNRNPHSLYIAIWLLSFVALRGAAVAQSYTITDVGLLQGNKFAEATGVGGNGQVVGVNEPAANSTGTAVVWSPTGGLRALKVPAGFNNSAAWAINNRGDAVGQAAAPNGYLHAMLWTHDGRVTDLGVPKGASGSTAYDVNDLDEVIGWGATAFVWTASKGFQDLGTLPGGTFSVGWRVNLAGEAVGFGDTLGGTDHAFVWTAKHGMKELRLLPGGKTCEALGNNNFSQIVGSCDSTDPNLHAVLWSINGKQIVDLGVLPGFVNSAALAINDHGVVVGECDFPTGHAFVWTSATGMLDLNNLIPANSGWVLNVATFVSPKGQISGYGMTNGETHGFLLTPAGN